MPAAAVVRGASGLHLPLRPPGFFSPHSRTAQVIEENVALLRDKYAVAKSLGESVNGARDRINQLKAVIERERAQRVAAAVAEGLDPSSQQPGRDEMEALQEMARERARRKLTCPDPLFLLCRLLLLAPLSSLSAPWCLHLSQEAAKASYKEGFAQLRELKREIEHVQARACGRHIYFLPPPCSFRV